MKTILSTALLGLAAALAACGTGNGDGSSETLAPSPMQASEASPARAAEAAAIAEASDRAAFESGIAAEGEAFAQPVSPELERELEAGYQASLRQRLDERAVLDRVEGKPQTDVR